MLLHRADERHTAWTRASDSEPSSTTACPASRSCFIRGSCNHRPVQTQDREPQARRPRRCSAFCMQRWRRPARVVPRRSCETRLGSAHRRARQHAADKGRAVLHVTRTSSATTCFHLTSHCTKICALRQCAGTTCEGAEGAATASSRTPQRAAGALPVPAPRGPHPPHAPRTSGVFAFLPLRLPGASASSVGPRSSSARMHACAHYGLFPAACSRPACGPAGRWAGPRRLTRMGRRAAGAGQDPQPASVALCSA